MFNQEETKCIGSRTIELTNNTEGPLMVRVSKTVVPKPTSQYPFEYDNDLFSIDPSKIS